MPTLNQLRGLKATDRTNEEQKAINQQMGYKEKPAAVPVVAQQPTLPTVQEESNADTTAAFAINQAMKYKKHLDEQYQQALAEREEAFGLARGSVNTNANDYLDSIASNASSYYKKFKDTDKLPLDDQEKKQLAAQYDARKATYGEQNADVWLDKYMKDKVGQNQSWWEQATNGLSHLIPAIEGGAIQTYGMLHGALAHIFGAEGYGENEDLNWWDSFISDVIDNPVTRYGRDIEMSGASHVSDALNLIGLSDQTANERIAAMKETATKYNPEGIGEDAIVTTNEQDETYFNATTPWQALQSGGFTALSMITGAAEAKAAGWLFNSLAKGANWLNKTNRIIKTEKGLEKTLEALKKAQNFTDIAVIPGAVGSVEGAMEGLNTKLEVERDAIDKLDEYYKDKVSKEVEGILNDDEQNPLVEIQDDMGGKTLTRLMDPNEIFRQVWDKYKDEYTEARRQIDWASSKAGIHNFYANSLINGMMNTTLKAGLMAPRVQETLRNSKMFGWAYKNPKFNIAKDGVTVTPKMSKAGIVGRVLKEPFGEGSEEYLQSLSSDVFASAAENNIDEFIKNKFEGDGTAKITDSFSSDYAAALTALKGSLTNKESIESAILGAVSSTMGTVGNIGRGYHRDEKGNLVQNSLFDARNFTRGLTSSGEQESWTDYARRVTPWRSGLINAYFDRRQEMADTEETAANLTEWLKNTQNKAKWDGLVGTANWMTQMENAAESNDQFSYRKAQMGKAINDVFMLSKLKGTKYYDDMIADLQRAASGEISQENIQKLKKNGGEDYQNISDEELVEKVQSNANHMLGLMSQVEQEGRSLDRMLGRIDEDTKQSLIFGKIMEEDFRERRDQLQEEIDAIKGDIQNSRSSNTSGSFEENIAQIMLKYGSLNHAIQSLAELQKRRAKVEQQVAELEAIDKNKTSDKQKEDLIKGKNELKQLDRAIDEFNVLYVKDEKGKKTDQLDDSLQDMVLNEQAIMDLDPVTRAIVLAQGAAKLYNATHQNRQRVDQLNLEIDEINHQIDALENQKAGWTNQDGTIKKHHNKQVNRNNKKIEELTKQKEAKMRALDAEQGRMDTKPIYNSAQQEVIDNLVQQGIAQDRDFLDKVVDMGRLEKGIKDYHTQYQAILSDPRAFHNYVQRAKYNAQRDLTRRRAERVANIEDFKEYSQELDRLTANASEQEMREIYATVRNEDAKQKRNYQRNNMVVDENTGELVAPTEQPKTNYDRYVENAKKQGDLVRQFAKNPNLTDNDQSLLLNAMQYLSSNGIDVSDREAAVQALIEKDEQGNLGGKFRQWVEAKNDMLPAQQRTFMPRFTSIGEIVGNYVDLINGATEDAVNRGNANPTVSSATPAQGQPAQPTVVTPPSPSAPAPETNPTTNQPEPQSQGPNLFNVGYSSPNGGQITGDGSVATDTQTQSMQQRQQQQNQPEEEKSELRQMFEKVATPEIAKALDDASHLIDNSNLSDEAKALARQYLEDIAVNSNEKFSTIDDLMTAVQEQINMLKSMSAQQEQQEQQENYNGAAGVLQKVYGSLNAKKMRGRRRTIPNIPHREENPEASWISTANIPYMEQQNPDAWAVVFTNDHKIDKFVEDNWLNGFDDNTPVYFITDSEWAAEVTTQMQSSGGQYNTLTHMPIVAAIRVEAPQNPANTTAIEVNGLWYQPIGVMPSAASRVSGAATTSKLRSVASKEQGRHLITTDGMPNGKPLASRVFAVKGHHRDHTLDKRHNTKENNNNVYDIILDDSSRELWDKAQSSERKDVLDDTEYLNEKSSFLNRLTLEEDFGGTGNPHTAIVFTPKSMKKGKDGKEEPGSQIEIFTKPMSETADRDTGKKTLGEVLTSGSNEDIINFNSRTQRLYNEVIRPIFQHIQYNPVTRSGDTVDRAAKIIAKEDVEANPNAFQEEADRLTKLLNGYDGREETKGLKGVSSFIYVKPGSGWSIKVFAPENLQTVGDTKEDSQSTYKVFFVNTDPSVTPIELGTIHAGQRDTDAAMQLLRNIMFDATTGQIRDFLNWQVPYSDIQNIHNPDTDRSTRAKQNIAAIIDDGILEVPATSLRYDIDGLKLRAPFKSDGSPAYPTDAVANPTNAQSAAPQNNTPQGDGATTASNGQPVEPDSGANLGEKPEGKPSGTAIKSEKLKQAERIKDKIIADSKDFTLSEDETYYYITDKNSGERVKYLRVTTVIGADESAPQWEPEIKDVLDKLKGNHVIPDAAYNTRYRDTEDMSDKLGIPAADIKRAVAELRTTHKHEGYGAWGTPSTSIGNTFDAITRDFLAGHLKEKYPNVNKEVLDTFIHQLELFKADCGSKIHLISEGVMAHGTITMTDNDGNTHDVKVAGTLDLFGYDDDGNFYIFDMKTTRDHTEEKLKKEKAKWSRQISMYADLLKQSYPGFTIAADRLRIIPINIYYDTPMGKSSEYLDPSGPKYSEIKEGEKKGQLQMQYRGHDAKDFEMDMRDNPRAKAEEGDNVVGMRKTGWREQYKPGYTPFNINWDNLSSEDQDIADALTTQANNAEHSAEQAPQTAHIETPAPERPSFIAADAFVDDYEDGTQEAAPQAPPIIPVGQKPVLPSWKDLSDEQKQVLDKVYLIDNIQDYNELLNDPAEAQGIAKDFICRGLM